MVLRCCLVDQTDDVADTVTTVTISNDFILFQKKKKVKATKRFPSLSVLGFALRLLEKYSPRQVDLGLGPFWIPWAMRKTFDDVQS